MISGSCRARCGQTFSFSFFPWVSKNSIALFHRESICAKYVRFSRSDLQLATTLRPCKHSLQSHESAWCLENTIFHVRCLYLLRGGASFRPPVLICSALRASSSATAAAAAMFHQHQGASGRRSSVRPFRRLGDDVTRCRRRGGHDSTCCCCCCSWSAGVQQRGGSGESRQVEVARRGASSTGESSLHSIHDIMTNG